MFNYIKLFTFGVIISFAILSCTKDSIDEKYPDKSWYWKSSQRKANEITCHWSTNQVPEGACWCIWSSGERAGITLVPNRFCQK